jgi:hypothetical protein
MEHRWHARGDVELDVVLYHQGIPVARCEAHNISPNGIFIEPASEELDVNTPVELEFVLGGKEKAEHYRINARVVHQSGKGTGLMFSPSETQPSAIYRLLDQVVNRQVT